MYRNVLFDLYGTLVDIHTDEKKRYLWQKMSDFFRAYGAYYTPTALRKAYLHYVTQLESQLGGPYPEIQIELVFLQLYLDKGIHADPALIQSTGTAFRTISRSRLALYPDVLDLLNGLKERHIGIYLLSNAQHLFTEPEMQMTGLLPFFDGVFYSSDIGCKKPDPTFMELLLSTYGLDKKECVMIGNEAASDVAVAEACGMDSIYLHTNLSPQDDSAPAATWQLSGNAHLEILSILDQAK
ncbi:MAG: HAD family hydrolase [Lachnospiraceae bacterium]|nr:HAD family hydrolase [Lachnospiraceae bacterium]